jgi:hypothetical protein
MHVNRPAQPRTVLRSELIAVHEQRIGTRRDIARHPKIRTSDSITRIPKPGHRSVEIKADTALGDRLAGQVQSWWNDGL